MNSTLRISKHTDHITQEIWSFYRTNHSPEHHEDIIWEDSRTWTY